ncbi:MAG: anthranilate phosphoribosyltransferase [Candidatus Omnitrophota bacterium]
MILMIDNYDSFTFNLVQLIQTMGHDVKTVRNDEITLAQITCMRPSHIIISPGPGRPDDAGISLSVIKRFGGKIPILGVCLGHQCIIQAYGGDIIAANRIVHGKPSPVVHDNKGLFRNLPQNFEVIRYHSLGGDPSTLPECLEVSATAADDETIMGVRHLQHPVVGVQFHPESIGTAEGRKILFNFFHYKPEEPQKFSLLKKLASGSDLTDKEAYVIMDEITDGEFTDSQIGAFLGGLSVKGVSPQELSSFVRVLREKTGVTSRMRGLLDTCGTGGDGRHTFNISTAAALLCGYCGARVAKHGNRAITSKSGSFDFLKSLGVTTGGDIRVNKKALKENNFAFFFAPGYHSAMRHVAKARRDIKIRTVFNMIGPLANPLDLDYQLVGVFSPDLLDLFAEAMRFLGRKRAMVVHSYDGMDEISVCAPTMVRELKKNGEIKTYDIEPADYGITGYTLDDLRGASAPENAAMFRKIMVQKRPAKNLSAIKAAVCLNAGAGLYISGQAESIREGFKAAEKAVTQAGFRKYIAVMEETE